MDLIWVQRLTVVDSYNQIKSNRPMVVTNLTIGIGNQLFQYATGLALARTNNQDFSYDALSGLGCGAEWEELPRYFNITHKSIQPSDLRSKSKFFYLTPVGSKVLRRYSWLNTPSNLIYRELDLRYDSALMQRKCSTYLLGYWQSPRYFQAIEDEIRCELRFKRPLSSIGQTLANKITATQSVSLHVRRGDYLSSRALSVHGTCTLDYYKRALDQLSRRVGSLEVFVFSDDIQWTKQNLCFPYLMNFVEHTTNKTADEDMHLMSLCHHNVIANSTFSWWGAWLNTNPGKEVIAPLNWYADNKLNAMTTDLIPSTWERL